MNFKFKSHIKTAYCNQDLVVLDLNSDQYHIISDVDEKTLNASLHKQSLDSELIIVDMLKELDAIQESYSTYDQVVPIELEYFFEQRWMTPIIKNCENIKKYHLSCFLEVLKVNKKMKKNAKIKDILKDLKSNKKINLSITPETKSFHYNEINMLMYSLNKCFLFDVTGNKCLAYSYILVLLARKKNIPAQLMIGVRTRPFFSHAWVELYGKVLNDESDIKKSLAVILDA